MLALSQNWSKSWAVNAGVSTGLLEYSNRYAFAVEVDAGKPAAYYMAKAEVAHPRGFKNRLLLQVPIVAVVSLSPKGTVPLYGAHDWTRYDIVTQPPGWGSLVDFEVDDSTPGWHPVVARCGTSSADCDVEVVGVLSLDLRDAAGGAWEEVATKVIVPGTTLEFMAWPDLAGSAWPADKPVWSGAVSATGAVIACLFDTYRDYTVDVECGNQKTVLVRARADLDIDSDNDNGVELPAGSEAEEELEVAGLGKILLVNDEDADGDGILDYADGYDANGIPDEDDASAGDRFVPLLLRAGNPLNVSEARIRFIYTNAPPGDVESGCLRLWLKDGGEARNKAEVDAGGDFVRAGVGYRWVDLVGSLSTVTLYVEGIRPTQTEPERQIAVEIAMDGENYVRQDTVNCTVLKVEIKDGENETNAPSKFLCSGKTQKFQAKIMPPLTGQYEWRITRGQRNADIDGANNQQKVTVKGLDASRRLDDVTLRLRFKPTGADWCAPVFHDFTVLKVVITPDSTNIAASGGVAVFGLTNSYVEPGGVVWSIVSTNGVRLVSSSAPHTLTVTPDGTTGLSYTVTAMSVDNTNANDQAALNVIKVSLKSMTFGGAARNLKVDTNGVEYPTPHWMPTNSSPVLYPRSVSINAMATFTVLPSTFGSNITLRGDGPGDLDFTNIAVTASGGLATYPATASAGMLTNYVNYWNQMEIKWKYGLAGIAGIDAGTSANKVYVSLVNPAGVDLYHTVVHLACSVGHATNTTQAVANSWSTFPGLGVKRFDGTPMLYWGPYAVANGVFSTAGLLANADGCCGAWANLLCDVLKVNGATPVFETITTKDIPVFGLLGAGFYVKNWNIAVNPPVDLTGISAQNNPNPKSDFADHAVVKEGLMLFDPSYGKTYTNLTEWEDASLDLLLYTTNIVSTSYVGRVNTLGDQQTKMTP